jgi:hypothetical protein
MILYKPLTKQLLTVGLHSTQSDLKNSYPSSTKPSYNSPKRLHNFFLLAKFGKIFYIQVSNKTLVPKLVGSI